MSVFELIWLISKMGNVEIWQMANVVSKPPQIIFTHKIQFLVRKILFPLNVKKKIWIWINDMIPAVWLIVLKAGCSWGFSNSLIIYLSYWQSLFILENSQGEKTVWFANMGPIRIFMPTSITEKWPFYLYVSFHGQQLDAFTHVKALQFCPDI